MLRTMLRALASAVAMAALLGAVLGCGDGAPAVESGNEEATVKGNVTFKGKPLADGEITFDGSNIKRKDGAVKSAKVKAGAYEIKALAGGNSISVHSKEIDKDTDASANSTYKELKTGEENIVDIDL